MKTIYHVPTEQFGFIEIEMEEGVDIPQISINARIEQYRAISEAVKVPTVIQQGLSSKEWNTALDSYINGNPMAPDTYYAMSPEQQKIIQELKKCFKRLKSKESDVIAGVDFGKDIDLLEDL